MGDIVEARIKARTENGDIGMVIIDDRVFVAATYMDENGVHADAPRERSAIATAPDSAPRDGCDWKTRAYKLAAELERILAVTPCDGWRHIDSAPKDGRSVLLWFPDIQPPPHVFIGYWRWLDEPSDLGDWHDHPHDDLFEIGSGQVEPTLWQPLPDPPIASASSSDSRSEPSSVGVTCRDQS